MFLVDAKDVHVPMDARRPGDLNVLEVAGRSNAKVEKSEMTAIGA